MNLFWRRAEAYLVVEWVDPLGWYVRGSYEEYGDAYDARAALAPDEVRATRVMTQAEWERRTLKLMLSDAPWRAAADLAGRLSLAENHIRSLETILNARPLVNYGERGDAS